MAEQPALRSIDPESLLQCERRPAHGHETGPITGPGIAQYDDLVLPLGQGRARPVHTHDPPGRETPTVPSLSLLAQAGVSRETAIAGRVETASNPKRPPPRTRGRAFHVKQTGAESTEAPGYWEKGSWPRAARIRLRSCIEAKSMAIEPFLAPILTFTLVSSRSPRFSATSSR